MSSDKSLVGVNGDPKTMAANSAAKANDSKTPRKAAVAQNDSKDKTTSELLAKLRKELKVADSWADEVVSEDGDDAVEVKEQKKLSGIFSSPTDLHASALHYYRNQLFGAMRGKGKQRGSLSKNGVYRMEVNMAKTTTASGAGTVAGSPRYGNTSDYSPLSSFFVAIFARFRIVHVKVYVTVDTPDNSSATTPHELVAAVDTSNNSTTTTSLTQVWQIPGSQIVVCANTPNGGPSGKLKPVFSFKVIPEQEWFNLNSDTQRGSIPFYGTGWTNTTGTVTFWFRTTFEFSGMIL
jgi:hypothetical protein